LGSGKGQLAETLDSGQSFGCRPMTLSGLKSVDQQIRPPLAAPGINNLAASQGQLSPESHPHSFPFYSIDPAQFLTLNE
jgi:hypothetical protein